MNKTNFVSTLLVTTALVSLLIAVSFGDQSPYSRPTLLTVPESPPGRDGPALVSNEQDLEVEVITATPEGFEPTAITRPRGSFILALHNRSGERELRMRIFRASGEQLQEVRLRLGTRRQHQPLDLPAGEYLITEAGHPDWRCQLIVSPLAR